MDKLIIKTAKITDAQAIARVRNLTWLDTYPSKKYNITRKMLEKMDLGGPKALRKIRKRINGIGKNLHLWVAKDKETVVGYITVFRKPGKNYLGSFYVLPEYQGRGIGTTLMGKALKWFGLKSTVELGVASYSKKTIRFYKKFGFQIIGPNRDAPTLPSGRLMPSIKMIKHPN